MFVGFGIRKLLQLLFGIRWDSGFGIRKLLQLLFGIRLGFVLGFAKLLQLRFGIPWDSGFGIRSFLQLPFGIRFGIRSTFTNSDGQLHMESTTPLVVRPCYPLYGGLLYYVLCAVFEFN